MELAIGGLEVLCHLNLVARDLLDTCLYIMLESSKTLDFLISTGHCLLGTQLLLHGLL